VCPSKKDTAEAGEMGGATGGGRVISRKTTKAETGKSNSWPGRKEPGLQGTQAAASEEKSAGQDAAQK